MGSKMSEKKRHAVLIPFPAQGHINPFLHLANLLHSSYGFHITFINTHFNHQRLIRSGHPSLTAGHPSFRFESIPDGLPPSDPESGQFMPDLISSIPINFPSPFLRLLENLNSPVSGVPPISCIVCDGMMTFALDAAGGLEVPGITFWTASACGFMAYFHFDALARRGLAPLKGEVSEELLDIPIDWIPGMKQIRVRDMPSFHRPTDPGDIVFNYIGREARRAAKATAIIVNTLEELERPILDAMATDLLLPPVYAVGPISLLSCLSQSPIKRSVPTVLLEDGDCLPWLNGRKQGSVLYVNFGSIVMLSELELEEFAWGLAGSCCDFLWVIRRDLVTDSTAVVPVQFALETKERGLVVSWCDQERILAHPAVGGFLTHSGWNSTVESIAAGVPMICWPFLAEQMTNCKYVCSEWGVGVEIGSNVKREEVAVMVREVMRGEKGKEMRKKAGEWKIKLEDAASTEGGSSFVNMQNAVKHVILP
ncbi:UDP-glycosyltransferase 85A2 [Platanthera zijinensis]|uniref:Glycosyltransferase n=1 Tax=Platanthera zijinensis TaxID=2320716 RepID=A0AAP0BIU1_9ASPA